MSQNDMDQALLAWAMKQIVHDQTKIQEETFGSLDELGDNAIYLRAKHWLDAQQEES